MNESVSIKLNNSDTTGTIVTLIKKVIVELVNDDRSEDCCNIAANLAGDPDKVKLRGASI